MQLARSFLFLTMTVYQNTEKMRPADLKIMPYYGIDATLRHIKTLIRENVNSPEISNLDPYNLYEIFDFVKNIPYVADPNNFEWLQSPRWTIQRGGDCDDKSIFIGAVLERRKIPYRMAVVSTNQDKELHHIYPEIFINGAWLPFDATYNRNEIFVEEPFTLKRIYSWFNKVKTETYEIHPDTNELKRFKTLAGNMLGESTRLAILRGCKSGQCDCTKCTKNCPRRRAPYNPGLGFIDPGTVVTVGSIIYGLFGGLFSKEKYIEAYAAWDQAEKTLRQAYTNKDWNLVAASRAIIAVLSRDYMNPPMGADHCTSSNRCGNRAEWLKIQPEVEQKAGELAPFFLWLEAQKQAGKLPPGFRLEDMVQWYDQKKNNGPLYQQFLTAQSNAYNTAGANAGQFSKLLPFALAAVAIYVIK